MTPTFAFSDYAEKHSRFGTGNSYSTLTDEQVIELVQSHWDERRPGAGETGIDRKVLVPVPPENFYCAPRAPLIVGMPVKARVFQRQDGEDPYIETYITTADAMKLGIPPTSARRCDIVCYSAEALLENGGHRNSDADWEVVTILGYPTADPEPMLPLPMARNFLEKPGGTKSVYTAQEFAEAIYHHASRKGIKIIDE